ncbi:MAG: hypothetical protein V1734_05020 [Nanoarchaeota archaeon]
MKTKNILALGAAVGLAALVGGCKTDEKAKDWRHWEGILTVEAPACDNSPYVSFDIDSTQNGKTSRYIIKCGRYRFSHIADPVEMGGSCRNYLEDDGRLDYQSYSDENCDDIADSWQWATWNFAKQKYILIEINNEPSSENYQNAIQAIGKEDIEEKWIEWLMNPTK